MSARAELIARHQAEIDACPHDDFICICEECGRQWSKEEKRAAQIHGFLEHRKKCIIVICYGCFGHFEVTYFNQILKARRKAHGSPPCGDPPQRPALGEPP